MTQPILSLQIMRAGYGEYSEPKKRLRMAKVVARGAEWNDGEGEIRHHIRFIHLRLPRTTIRDLSEPYKVHVVLEEESHVKIYCI